MSKSIILDAGHGGTDVGATGNGLLEKNLNIKMTNYQYNRLKELGAKVSRTRSGDQTVSSQRRTQIVRQSGADVCISNHFNAFNGKARGVETIHSYLAKKTFATNLANAIVRTSGLPLRRVFTRRLNNGKDYYFMHRDTGRVRTVIIEYGFIDNKSDMQYFKNDTNFYNVAEAVVKEICKEIGISYKPKKQDNQSSLYKVQTGAFKDKKNAQQLEKKLKKDGYDTFITKE